MYNTLKLTNDLDGMGIKHFNHYYYILNNIHSLPLINISRERTNFDAWGYWRFYSRYYRGRAYSLTNAWKLDFLPWNSDPRTWELTAPTIDPTSSWLLPHSTAIGWLNEEDTISSWHLWWGPPALTFWCHCREIGAETTYFRLG